ncbi:hypothetical protein KI387_013486, partial [Taxus chinensis]
ELELKRKRLESDFGGRKFVKRSEIERKEIDRLREEERRELEQKNAHKNRPSDDGDSANTNSQAPSIAASRTSLKSKEDLAEEQKIDDLVLPRAEVIRRLRFLKQPITLFGEDDDSRLDRLKSLLKAGIMDPDADMTEGQRNDFLRDLAELQKRQKTGILQRKKGKGKDGGSDGEDEVGV